MKKIFAFLLTTITFLSAAPSVYAVCPVCTVAVAAGLGLSRWLGIDDTISGIWIGGLILSSSLWLVNWIKEKYPKIPQDKIKYITIVFSYLMVIVPLYYSGVIGHPFNKIWGMDKLVAGIISGSLAFLSGIWIDKKIRKVKGKQLFKFQKVVFPILSLLTTSVVFFTITSLPK